MLALIAILALLWAWDLPPFGGRRRSDRRRLCARPHHGDRAAGERLCRGGPGARLRSGAGRQVLVRIDDSIYRARVAQAQASLAAAQAALSNSDQAHAARRAALLGQTAGVANARAQLLRAQADMARVTDLVRDGSVSIRERDQTRAALAQAEAQVRQAEAGRRDRGCRTCAPSMSGATG
ncbi:MAG: hypothetical protein WDM81_14745 [Rhizomicrobium sp.]